MEISELSKTNPWWQSSYNMESDKHLSELKELPLIWEPKIIESFSDGIYTLRGPRQVGKTTWIKTKIRDLLKVEKKEDIFFYSCDLMRQKEQIVDLVESYLNWNPQGQYLFLDEVAYVEDWQLAVKHLVDTGVLKNKRVLVTGSNSLDMNKNIEQLPGRIGKGKRHFVFFPMSFGRFIKLMKKEIADDIYSNNLVHSLQRCELYSEELNRLLRSYVITGGFPKVVNEYFKNQNIHDDIYDLYISWIKGEIGKWKRDENTSIQIIRKIIESYVTHLNWSSIKSATGIESHHTVSGYVEMLEKMFLLQFIYGFDPSDLAPAFRKNKKIYFVDPFIYAAMEKWSFGFSDMFEKANLKDEQTFSRIIEGVLLNHLVAHETKLSNSNMFDYKNRIFYLRTKRGREIDFVIKRDDLLGYVEVKWREKDKLPRGFEGLRLTKNKLDLKSGKIPVSFFMALEEHYDSMLFDKFAKR